MREDWVECTFEDLLDYEQPTKYIVKSTKYSDDYKTPVLTAGKSFIKGYTNETTGIFNDLPTIIFDDFTTATQFVDFEFKVKSSAMKILVPTSKLVNMKFLFNCIQVNQVRNDTHKRYWISVYAKKKILLPPLAMQNAILSKTEEIFSDLDNGIANFKKAQEQLKIYRQAVLKKAFEGELTKEWRALRQAQGTPRQAQGTPRQAQGTPQQAQGTGALSGVEVPIAEELLKQIKEERQNHYNQQIEEWKKAVKEWEMNGKKGKRPSRISKPKEVSEVKESDIENYETLPISWKWSRFGNVTYKIGDIDHKMPKTVENGYSYLSTGNLNGDGTIDFSGAKTISKEDFDRLALKIKPQKGDIIFPRYGTIGRNILIDFDREFLVSYSCAIIKNITSLMSSKFALYYSLSPVIKKEIKKYTVETTQANIGIASIENFVFPLCSTQEQTQIVQEIESRLSVCDKMEQSISESLEKAEALRQSILKKAFEGKLLSQAEIEQCKQEADYEPASELLKKIKAEKLAKEQEKKKRKKK